MRSAYGPTGALRKEDSLYGGNRMSRTNVLGVVIAIGALSVVAVAYQQPAATDRVVEVDKLKDNLQALLADLVKAKPATAKGAYLQKISISSTMGPGVAVDQSSLSLK